MPDIKFSIHFQNQVAARRFEKVLEQTQFPAGTRLFLKEDNAKAANEIAEFVVRFFEAGGLDADGPCTHVDPRRPIGSDKGAPAAGTRFAGSLRTAMK